MGLNKQAYSLTWMENGAKTESDPAVWDYPLAAAQEVGEFMNSWSYAWWGTKVWPIEAPADRQNCMTELVDAWHFLVSQALIEEDGDIDRAARALLEGYAVCSDSGIDHSHRYVTQAAKKLMTYLYNYAEVPATLIEIYAQFFKVLQAAEFSLDHFTARYSAKLQLNLFRQLNGYNTKPRTYVKMWEKDKEDNYFLSEYIDNCFNSKDVPVPSDAAVMNWIAANYSRYTAQQAVTPAVVEDKKDDAE